MNEKRHFGTSKDGFEISEYILDNGLIEAHFLDYGCIIKNVFVAGKDGKRRDVVLGYDDLKSYEENGGYLGAFVGRVANRIKNAEFTLDGVKYRLFANDGKNCLHGGKKGFDKKFFETKIEDDSITFTTCSFDGEEGFPGGLSIEVKYTLRGSALDIEYKSVATADTPVSFTNHSYFNLSDEETALNHLLSVNSDFITPVNDTLIPTGELLSVSDTPFDFRNPQKVGLYIDYPHKQLKIAGGYDHNFLLKK